jgi:hypothetical protein
LNRRSGSKPFMPARLRTVADPIQQKSVEGISNADLMST